MNRKISVSALTKYWRCPELYRKIYVDKTMEREPPSIEMAVGLAVHAGLDYAAKRILKGYMPGITEMQLVAEQQLRKDIPRVPLDPVDLVGAAGNKIKFASNAVEQALKVALKELVPKMNPLMSEYRFLEEWRPGWNIDGAMDRLDLMPTGDVVVVDYKIGTSSRTPDQKSAENSFQLAAYAIMVRRTLGYVVKRAQLVHYVPSKRPHFLTREATFTDKYLKAAELKINRTLDAIEAGQFPPGDPFWVCNETRCPHFNGCEMGAGVEPQTDEPE